MVPYYATVFRLYITVSEYNIISGSLMNEEDTVMFTPNKNFGKATLPRTVRFTDEIYERLNEVASERDVSINSLILQCCQYAMDHMKPDEPPKS